MELSGRSLPDPDSRASDADRDRVATFLQRHTVEGRLTTDELSERLEVVFASRTYGELERVVGDLPDLPDQDASKRKRMRVGALRSPSFRHHLKVYGVVNGSLVGLWAMVDFGSYFWPAWPMWGWGMGLALHAVGVRSAQRARIAKSQRVPRRAPQSRRRSSGGRRWITAMFVDVVGSTSFVEMRGDESWSVARRRLRTAVDRASRSSGGSVAGSQGDGFLLRFPSPPKAVEAAVAVQESLADDPDGLQVRIGIHAGEVLVEADRDLVGRVVHIASRVTDQAGPGEIVVTEPVADQLPDGIRLKDLGLRELRGVGTPRHLLALDPDRTG